MNSYLIKDLLERAAKTFLWSFAAVLTASGTGVDALPGVQDWSVASKAFFGGIAAVIGLVVNAVLGPRIGSANTAAWLPVSEDTPRPLPDGEHFSE